jgi:glycerol-3-phosphate acyltransferase PlsX
MRIALDAMGGDHAPAAAVAGAVSFARWARADSVILVGDAPRIEAELTGLKAQGLVRVHHAPDVVGMGDSAARAVRARPRSSIRVCLELVKRGEADAAVSAGSSGALMAAALLVLGRLPGVERPAIVTPLPTLQGHFAALLDSGANVSCRPIHLVQFAHLGAAWARRAWGIERPRVALLSNGEERCKGTELTRAAFEALERSALDFVGYVEGKDLFTGAADVIVTDGFTGNVVLKTTEGAAAALGAMLKREIESRSTARIGRLLMAPAFAGFKKIMDWAEYGGAPLLGVAGTCLAAHGRSGPRAFKNALAAVARADAAEVSSELSCAAQAARALMPPRGRLAAGER